MAEYVGDNDNPPTKIIDQNKAMNIRRYLVMNKNTSDQVFFDDFS